MCTKLSSFAWATEVVQWALDPLDFDICKMLSLSFDLVKQNSITVGHHLEKSTVSPLEKIVQMPQARSCVDQGFSNFFAHVPLSIARVETRVKKLWMPRVRGGAYNFSFASTAMI